MTHRVLPACLSMLLLLLQSEKLTSGKGKDKYSI
jgi:hypothetical protein